jgi:hypothetical protein
MLSYGIGMILLAKLRFMLSLPRQGQLIIAQ